MSTDVTKIQGQLAVARVAGVTIVWADNNGIPWSRTAGGGGRVAGHTPEETVASHRWRY